MKQTIAVITDENGRTSELLLCRELRIYTVEGQNVEQTGSLPCSIDTGAGLGAVRAQISQIEQALTEKLDGQSRILVGSSVTGLSYHVFDGAGYTIFEIDGDPNEFLDRLSLQLEKAETINEGETVIYTDRPIESDNGRFFIDLKTLQIKKPGVTSKQALMPFFNDTPFVALDMICAHIPPWFERDFHRLGLVYSASRVDDAYHVVVTHAPCCECGEDETLCVN